MSSALVAAPLPSPTGADTTAPCLCIGLDIAWFGGSLNKPDSQHDCLVFAVAGGADPPTVQIRPVPLQERDPDAGQIFAAIQQVVEEHGGKGRIVLAVDAPLQGSRVVPAGRSRARRACEDQLSAGRKAIDEAHGGSQGWHPNIQPGLPLAPRVQLLAGQLTQKLGMELWTPESAQAERLIIECFPAEAIWAAKRLGGYSGSLSSAVVKSYKKQSGRLLSAAEVENTVHRVLLDAFKEVSGMPLAWPVLVLQLVAQMLAREEWKTGDFYRGGKMLDDVVDSAICLATALSYAHRQAHVWHDPDHSSDGHIIGPGQF